MGGAAIGLLASFANLLGALVEEQQYFLRL